MCAITGVFNVDHAAEIAYHMAYHLQHRAQDSAGGVSVDNGEFFVRKGFGLLRDALPKRVAIKLPGRSSVFHLRYRTAGELTMSNIQPLLTETRYGNVAVSLNGNFPLALEKRASLIREGNIFATTADTEVALHYIINSGAPTLLEAVGKGLIACPGAYSLLFLTKDQLIAVRDPCGYRPLFIGRYQNGWIFASETCALVNVGASETRSLAPGEAVIVDRKGCISRQLFPQKKRGCFCIFEKIYIQRPDSQLDGIDVSRIRFDLGRALAREHPVKADCVVPILDSGLWAAIGFAAESRMLFLPGLIRNHYVDRTFIEPDQVTRNHTVHLKHSVSENWARGKRIALVDDSIVRGTTLPNLVRLFRQAGAKEVHCRISCPPIVSPCFFGVNISSKEELLAASLDLEEMRQRVGADSLQFLSLGKMNKVCGDSKGMRHCTSCFTGTYHTEVPKF